MSCTKFKSKGTIIDDGIDTANKLNTFFVKDGNTLAKSIPTSHKHPNDHISYNASNTFLLSRQQKMKYAKSLAPSKIVLQDWD